LKSLRLVNRDFAATTSRQLFRDVSITFKSSTFTKPARMAALERIGWNIRTVTFKIEHGPEMFLPPLLDPLTGEEVCFVFTPCVRNTPTSTTSTTTTASSSTAAGERQGVYGTWEMTDLLVKQYPPLFHAAMNVSSFVCALTYMPSLRHLKINCAGQDPAHRYRRSVVDYALSSLRIAIEQAPLPRLEALSLTPIHPGGIQYLCPMAGIGSLPNSCRRWTQIRRLEIHMDTFPFDKGQATDHLKLLHSYLQAFRALRSFTFRWVGATKGPSPLSLATEPALCELAARSQACPKTRHYLRPLKFPFLQYMVLGHAVVDASQVSDFLTEHRHSLLEFDFESVSLRSGSWDDALAPWRTLSSAEYDASWGEKQAAEVEVMEVPFVLGPSPDEEPSSSPNEHKHEHKRRKKKKKRHARTTEVSLNNDLFASTAAMLLEDEPVPRSNLNFRTLREGLSNWARSKAKPARMFWGHGHDYLHKAVQSPILV
jgi:hypothetical protein